MNSTTIRAAHGRWREILPALGLPSALFNGKHQPCPICGGTDRFRFDDRTKEGDFFCSMCGAGKGMQLLMRVKGWDFKQTANEVDAIIGNLPPPATEFNTTRANPAACRELWAAGEPISFSEPVGRYLASRGISSAGGKKSVRYIRELRHKPSGTVQHGMIAAFYDVDGKPATIHRTFLTGDGRKANVDPVRMFMPGKVPAGGAIRLYEPAEMMGIAEGIETALSAALLFGIPTWATTSATLLQQWQPPQITKHITIFADNDLNYVGQCAAYTLAKRLIFEAGRDKIERTVAVMASPRAGTDWNDHIGQELTNVA
jgi:putative DNA primase/helicase